MTGERTICFFGIYDPESGRARVLRQGFEANGFEVIECRVNPKVHRGISKYWHLYLAWRSHKSARFEHVLVCYPGHTVVWLARLLFGKSIILDAFV